MLLTIKQIKPTRASQLVRQARRSSGITQRALAERAGISQPSIAAIERSTHDATAATVERLVGAAGFGIFLLPTERSSVGAWAGLIHDALQDPDRGEEVAFRALIGLNDDLRAVDPVLQVALSAAPPPPCGDLRFDAALAALVEHLLASSNLPVPAWVSDPSRYLDEPWVVYPYPEGTEVPDAFFRHGITLAASELESV